MATDSVRAEFPAQYQQAKHSSNDHHSPWNETPSTDPDHVLICSQQENPLLDRKQSSHKKKTHPQSPLRAIYSTRYIAPKETAEDIAVQTEQKLL